MDEQPNVSPEEQAQYDEFVGNAYALIYGDSHESIVERLSIDEEPIQALAQTVTQVVRRVVESARQAGQELSSDVVFQGGVEVLEDLAATMGKLGIYDFSDEELEQATYVAMDLYRDVEIEAGELDQQAHQEDWQTLQQANETGEFDAVMQDLQAQSGGKEPGALSAAAAQPEQAAHRGAGGLLR